jgi:arylsulfatase A-like enzyme
MSARHVLLLVIASLPLFSARSSAQTTRPNFLFIITDDQRFDTMSVVQKEQGEKARFPWFNTPNFDRLASQGMRFRNAFVVNSLCSPSRACFLTGQYNHLNGVANNHTPFPPDNVTHASLLKSAGYTTAYFGKWHCDGQKERPGFDHFASFVGQGKYIDCPMLVNGKQTPTSGWVDDVTTDNAIEFLKQQKSADKPFDVVVGFKSPHGPFTPPERAKNRFAGEQLRPVPNLGLRPPYREKMAEAATQRRTGEGILNQLRCISAIDDCVGRILDTLNELKLAENTVVVFTSDNGYFFWEHGLGDKRAAYEESIRIPLLIRYPKLIKPGTTNDEMVLNIDYAPTILQLARVEVPQQMQGRSLVELLAAKTPAPFRDAFLYEYFYEEKFNTPTITAVRSPTAKLITYPDHKDWTELFDLAADPYETRNLAGDPAHEGLMKTMRDLLDRQVKASQFTIPASADKPNARGTHKLIPLHAALQ